MTFPAQVNLDLLYRSPDGRECFVIFDREKRLAYIGRDVADERMSVGFTPDALRRLADHLDNETPVSD